MLLNKIEEELTPLTGLKYSVGLEVLLRKDITNGTPTYTDPPSRFYTEQKAVLNKDEINLNKKKKKKKKTSTILERRESFIQNGSGWKVDSLMTLWLDFAKYEPIKGGSYLLLPTALKKQTNKQTNSYKEKKTKMITIHAAFSIVSSKA